MSEPVSRRLFLFALALPLAGPVRAQDNGAFFNEQVRRNQSMGIPTLPPAVQPPSIRGPGAFYHDEVRQRQEGFIGRRLPTRPTPGPQILTPEQRVVTPQAPIPPITTSSGRRFVGGRPVPIRRPNRRPIRRRASPSS